MKHTINDKQVEIGWEQSDLIDNHGSGCKEYMVIGYDDQGKKYIGSGTYQDDELIEVLDIEQI
jgi:hypothetical protein